LLIGSLKSTSHDPKRAIFADAIFRVLSPSNALIRNRKKGNHWRIFDFLFDYLSNALTASLSVLTASVSRHHV